MNGTLEKVLQREQTKIAEPENYIWMDDYTGVLYRLIRYLQGDRGIFKRGIKVRSKKTDKNKLT